MDFDATHAAGPRSALYPHWSYSSGVCAECRHAELFAVQPRARCTHPDGVFRGRVVFAGQRSCADFVPMGVHDVRLSAASNGTGRDTPPGVGAPDDAAASHATA